jgi:DNA-binding MarR family transcriptional regulator
MSEPMDTSAVWRCACTNIRRADRALTQFYDEILAPSGLYATQFALLATLFETAPITINRLAKIMILDRTTLTRNLELLIKQRLIHIEAGEDRRMRQVSLTEQGEQTLHGAWPLWQTAQARVEQALSRERLDKLLTELSAVVAIVR